MARFINRRDLFAGALGATPLARFLSGFAPETEPNRPARIQAALDLRTQAALTQSKRALASTPSNGEEQSLPGKIACFTKGLPHNSYGEVEPAAYDAMLSALQSARFADFEKIPRSGGRKLNNPQAAS